MKRGWKIFWLICVSVLGVGIILCIAGTVMGATLTGVRNTFHTDEYYRHGILWYHNDWDDSGDYDGDHKGDLSQLVDEQDVLKFDGIREIDLELSYMQVVVREGSGDSVIVDKSNVNDKLKDRINWEQDDGELTIKDQTTHNLLKKISVVEQFEVKELNIDCGAGQAELTGTVTHESEIECGVGSIDLALTGGQNEFDYELDCGIGQLRVGDESYTGLSNKRSIDNGTGKLMDIDCGIGEVQVSFGASL